MTPRPSGRSRTQSPVVLVTWYDTAKWLLERVDSFPKNQRFIFGQRIASDALDILELLVEAAYSRDKVRLLEDANRKLETLRWLLRMATDRKVLTGRQYQHACERLAETGRMVGGWLRQQRGRRGENGRGQGGPNDEAGQAPLRPGGEL